MSGETVGGVGEMQVVLLNVPVSSKPDKSNQVLSRSATISWLFEASGPCSSDLFGRGFLSRHLEVMWREKKGFFGVMVECARDIISVMMTETPLRTVSLKKKKGKVYTSGGGGNTDKVAL